MPFTHTLWAAFVVFIGIHHGNGGLKQAVCDGIFQQDHPVCINLVEAGLADELGKVLLVAEDGMFKAGVDEASLLPLKRLSMIWKIPMRCSAGIYFM